MRKTEREEGVAVEDYAVETSVHTWRRRHAATVCLLLIILCLALFYSEPSLRVEPALDLESDGDQGTTFPVIGREEEITTTFNKPVREKSDQDKVALLPAVGGKEGRDPSVNLTSGDAREDPPVKPTAPEREPVTFDPQYVGGVLRKKAVSERMRLVFLVGLEGVGHHYMADVLDEMCKTASPPCPSVCDLAHALYPGLAKPDAPADYAMARRSVRIEMQALASAAREIPQGRAKVVGFGQCRYQVGMMSYPNFNGPSKALQYVDFAVAAEEAERAGIDLRIIYLHRSAQDILISDTSHHAYGTTFMKEARALIANADIVESTFQEIDLDFVTCMRYENIADPVQAKRVAEFVAPTNYKAGILAQKMLDKVKVPSSVAAGKESQRPQARPGHRAIRETRLDEAQKLVADRLQQKLDKIERNRCLYS